MLFTNVAAAVIVGSIASQPIQDAIIIKEDKATIAPIFSPDCDEKTLFVDFSNKDKYQVSETKRE